MLKFIIIAVIVAVIVDRFVVYLIKKNGVTKTKTLTSGELIIKTYDGQYFHAIDSNSVPVLISKEEGKRLWTLEEEKK